MAVYKCAGRFRINPETDEPVCKHEAPRPWRGRCPSCRMPYACDKVGAVVKKQEAPVTLASEVAAIKRYPTEIAHFDDVIGGGLVDGAVILIGGVRGSGKSTLMVMLADSIASDTRRVLYASAEENADSVVQIAQRIHVKTVHVDVMGNAYDLDAIFQRALETKARVLIIDSLQAITEGEGITAGNASGRGIQAATEIGRFCERTGVCALVINHVTRSNDFAGSMTVEHFVKAIFMFAPWDQRFDGKLSKCLPTDELAKINPDDVRVLLGVGKNRIGPANEKRFFEMTKDGVLRPIQKRTSILGIVK